MAYSILEAIAQQSSSGTSVQILPVNIYGSGESTTSWIVALGIQKAVDNGATILNLSLGGAGTVPFWTTSSSRRLPLAFQ